MTTEIDTDRDLMLTRVLDAPREKVFRCWTDPEVMLRWFTPPPWRTTRAELDLRPGGASLIVMTGPGGEEMPNRGVYLEVVPNERLVFTDAYESAWKPSARPFFTVILSFEDAGEGKTRYTAVARHWTKADKEAHEPNFNQGWAIATDQLEATAKTL